MSRCPDAVICESVFGEVYQLTFFTFILCLNRDLPRIGTRDWAKKCSEETGVDYAPVDQCANSELGKQLFVDSVHVTNERGVTKSCTIYVNGKPRCIRDGRWYSCADGHTVDDFVRTIVDAYNDQEVIA
ncbi:16712_t:CDS:2 [Acaulospora colombiana]|uniref:16712_t:CDS:1 n=1 Tax=Acaulospora colombiana TaxID=27376 RepID=A0ACA9LJ86_9GLOM|nr:16712_t:CDS:2 [Acaulospora colombiana]